MRTGARSLFLARIGGDPAMHSDLVYELEEPLRDMNIPIPGEVVTNGTLLSDQSVQACLHMGVHIRYHN